MPESHSIRRIGLAVALIYFVGPILVNLGEPDLQSDESIYAYATERIVDTGDWLTPRYIPTDGAFLEKPPLKMWLSAAAISSGLVPRNEAGLRLFDGLFGAIGFLYVFLIGRRLAGTACGLASLLTLFALHPLLFEHGLRSANMESCLFLSYCGGLYHFARWNDEPPGDRALGHAMVVALFFFLGFMTKFVAVAFLPIVAGAAFLCQGGGLAVARDRLREWAAPTLLVAAASAPWYLYQWWQQGDIFWDIIFGAHIFQRFTSSLDPSHLQPWFFYVTTTWDELGYAGVRLLTAVGLLRLSFIAWRGDPWVARLVLMWGVVPLALISTGTSKLLHYAYPFWPPIGLAAGLATAWVLEGIDGRRVRRLADGLSRLVPHRVATWSGSSAWARVILVALAMVAVVLAVWTGIDGPVRLDVGSVLLFRNSSVVRPAFFASALLLMTGYSRNSLRLFGAIALAFLLPLGTYTEQLELLSTVDHPIRATRNCIDGVRAGGVATGEGTLAAGDDVFHLGYYFYLGRAGPLIRAPYSRIDVLERLTTRGRQTPVLIERADYEALVANLPPEAPPVDTAPVEDPATADLRRTLLDGALRYDDRIAILLPGPFRPCLDRILAAGGRRIWPTPPRDGDR